MSPNLGLMPPTPPGVEVWASNWYKGYNKRHPRILKEEEWTRWFNLHSRAHMDTAYPTGVKWYKEHCSPERPIYFQKHQPDIPGSIEFPRKAITDFFGHSFFTFTGAWQMALAIFEGFERIELWGFELKDKAPTDARGNPRSACYTFERPCFFYWVQEARRRDIEVVYQAEIEALPFEPGDPFTFTGPIYGYETKSEEGWNPTTKRFDW